MTDDTTDDLQQILQQMNQLARAAYDRGFQAGGIAMRNSIIAAANAPMMLRGGAVTVDAMTGAIYDVDPMVQHHAVERASGGPRAPRGLVADIIRSALTHNPGQTIVQLEKFADLTDDRVNRKTVGNQLRRFEGVLYERDGYRWYLKGQKQSAELPLQVGSADLSSSNQKGGEGE